MENTKIKTNNRVNEERIRIVAKQLLKEIVEKKMEEDRNEL
ncbi:MAG: hypothetical protein Q4B56_08585 [Erysipelotrichaceae bacterium]|nr:hypothetical protein [Erysipelotrichaceae bacterium]